MVVIRETEIEIDKSSTINEWIEQIRKIADIPKTTEIQLLRILQSELNENKINIEYSIVE